MLYRPIPDDPREVRRQALARRIGRSDITYEDLEVAEARVAFVMEFGASCSKISSYEGQHPIDWDMWWCHGCSGVGTDHWLLWHHCPPSRLQIHADTCGRVETRRRCEERDRQKWPFYRRWTYNVRTFFMI